MSIASERERLSQRDTLENLLRRIGPTEMVRVYGATIGDGEWNAIYCALIPSEQIEDALQGDTWDLSHGQGLPSSNGMYRSPENLEYLRFGNSDGIEPLVIDRIFHGPKEDYVEISEEFRLFHNLYHDQRRDEYIKLDDSGNEIVVAVVKPKLVKIRMKELRQFLAIKEMHLSIQFDCVVHSENTLDELGLTSNWWDEQEGLSSWDLSINSDGLGIPGKRASSRLLGERLIEPLPKSKSGVEGFAEPQEARYVDFIIQMDDNGDDILHTCNPDALSNFFGRNPGAAHEVTPVSFRKAVLDKYYQQPSKYSIEDGYLSCPSLWDLRIDNHHDDKVCVLLRDLAYLPYDEQLYWRPYNFASESGYSKVAIRRNFLVEWVDSDRPEHTFQEKYHDLTQACRETLGWQLLLPLNEGDEYHLHNIRVPATNEQRDFDGLVLGLATILADSINVQGLKTLVSQYEYDGKSIRLLDTVLETFGADGAREHIDFLINLQSLRSSGAAHRKGTNYHKVAERFGVGNDDLRLVFADILWKAVALLDYLAELVQSRKMQASAEGLTLE